MKLIDADALKEKLDELEPYIDCDENSTAWIESDEVYNAIDNAPTVEAVSLEHHNKIKGIMDNEIKSLVDILDNERPKGEWKPFVYDYHMPENEHGDHIRPPKEGEEQHWEEYWAPEYYCSICGAKNHMANFCPWCGADMRKGGVE
jgi:hypothetical protein